MKFGNDSSVTVENNGENHGIMVGTNYGSMIIQNQYGLGYNETKSLCLDIVRDALSKYRADALIEAQKRSEKLLEDVVQKLNNKRMTDTQALSEFRTPSMQIDYLEAQKAYIKVGTPELAEMLSDILVERISEPYRSPLQIALSEAIQVAPKLSQLQMAELALAFVLSYTHDSTVTTYQSFSEFLRNKIILLFDSGIAYRVTGSHHFDFTGCSQYSVNKKSLIQLLKETYTGIFMAGFYKDEIPKAKSGHSLFDIYPLFIPCPYNRGKIQINVMTNKLLSQQIQKLSMPLEDATILRKLFDENVLPDNQAQELVEKLAPDMRKVFEYWESSEISHYLLTDIGIIIGAEYAHQITGEKYKLSWWV